MLVLKHARICAFNNLRALSLSTARGLLRHLSHSLRFLEYSSYSHSVINDLEDRF